MLKRLIVLPLVLLVAMAGFGPTMAQPATPGVHDAIEEHLAWVLGLFDGAAADLTVAEVEDHFDPLFLDVVPAEEFIATVQQLQRDLGPLELIEEQGGTAPGEFYGTFEAQSGERVMISIAVDPDSGLMAGFFITPAQAATPARSTPQASPVSNDPAGIVVTDPDAQIGLHQDQVDRIRNVGEPVVEIVLSGDDAALEPLLSPDAATALESVSIAEIVASFTTDQIQMSFEEADAHFFGQWRDDVIEGVMVQGGAPIPFTLQATEPQSGDGPSGRWDGELVGAGLELSVTFGAGQEGELTATLDIPAQNVTNQPMQDVSLIAEQPIGDLVQDRVFALGGSNNSYTAEFFWGDALLRVSLAVDVETETVTALQVLPGVPLPEDPAADYSSETAWRMPFEGTWWVFWGGDTELQNYHAVTPSQRHALDVVIWNDGATYRGDGAQNEDYWAWGQAVVAPATGTVVGVINDQPDVPPNTPPGQRNASENPGGNHVVIETGENEYAFIAHMQEGSVQVDVGDDVEAGDLLGLTGNSGNSSEPHIHIHVQDSPDILDFAATGLPLQFDDAIVDGEPIENAMPVQGSFIAPE